MLRVAIVLILVAGAQAYCEPFNGKPDVCGQLIPNGTLVWINEGDLQETIAASLEQNTSLIPLLGAQCGNPAIVAACLSSFRACAIDDLPAPVCPDVCTNFRGNCSSNPVVAPRLPDCSRADLVVVGQLLYEESRPLVNMSGTAACFVPASSSGAGCGAAPFPFEFNEKEQECQLTCPRPTLNENNKMHKFSILLRVIVPISLACQLFVFVPWAVQFRIANPFYPLFFQFAIILVSVGYMFSVPPKFQDWICIDRFTVRDQGNSVGCWFQGALIHGGILCSCMAITVLLYHLLNALKQDRFQLFGPGRLIPVPPLWVYTTLVFGVPAIFVIITSATMGYTADTGLICLPNARTWDRWALDAVFFFPIQILLMLDVLFGVPIFMVIWKLGGGRAMRSQLRLVVLCLYYWLVLMYGQAYLIYSRAIFLGLKSDIEAYVKCVLGVTVNGVVEYPPFPDGGCDAWVNPKLNFPAQFVSQLIANTTGPAVLFIFFRVDLLRVWGALLRGQWSRIMPGSSTGSGSGSGNHNKESGPESPEISAY